MKKLVRKGNKLFFSIFLTALFLSTIQAQIFTGTGFTITDGGGRVTTSCSTVAVSGVTTSVNVRSVSLNGATHSWLGDIEARVYPPAAALPPSTTGTVVIASPPDGRACNFSGNYRFIDSAAQSIDAATVGCADATNVASGDYRTSTYGGGTSPGPVTSLSTTFGALTPAQANGNWLVCVFDFATPDGGAVTSTSLQLTVLSAASVAVGGRITTAKGTGIGKVNVSLTGPSGTVRTALTNPFGYYRFEGVEVGANYIITAASKGYTFDNPTVVHFASEDNDGVNFTAIP